MINVILYVNNNNPYTQTAQMDQVDIVDATLVHEKFLVV